MLLYREALLRPKAGAHLNGFNCLQDAAAKGKIHRIRHLYWCPFLVGPQRIVNEDSSIMITYVELYNFDSLSDVTRKERRTLILVALIALAVSKLGLYPTEISALGINFTHNGVDIKSLIPLYFRYIIGYLLLTFSVYAASDFVRSWVVRYQTNFDAAVSSWREPLKLTEEGDKKFREQKLDHPPFRGARKPIFFIRGTLEFIFPLVFAVYALYAI